jgi:uncharacterized protein DUF4262
MRDVIRQNIRKFGFHFYLIGEDSTPRFAYTIGLRESLGAELVLAGAAYYLRAEVVQIVHAIRDRLAAGASPATDFSIEQLGSFTLRKAHPSWVGSLLLGATHYYGVETVETYQIVPDAAHMTIDVPDMGKEWSAKGDPVWQWLHEPWPYAVASGSTATTNLAALRGARVTEAARWEPDDWEIFAGEATIEDARIVPLGTFLATDPSIAYALDFEIGDGASRDGKTGGWRRWARLPDDAPLS